MSKILGDYLPQEVVELLNKELTSVIVSTVTPDGKPHALPIGLINAMDSRTIRMGFLVGHQSLKNIKQNKNTFITVIDGPDIAFGIKGTAKVIKEPMEGSPVMSMVEFKVEQVKSDTTPTAVVEQGIRIKPRTEKAANFMRKMFDEINT